MRKAAATRMSLAGMVKAFIGMTVVVCVVVVLFLNRRNDDTDFFVESSRKFTRTGASSKRWLAGERRGANGRRSCQMEKLCSNAALRQFMRGHRDRSECILGFEDGRVRKAYTTDSRGDIHSMELGRSAPSCFHYTQTDHVDFERFASHAALQGLSGRWGHIRRDEKGRVDAVYVSVLSDGLSPLAFYAIIHDYVGGRPWTEEERRWWKESRDSLVTFVGWGKDHMTLYYGLQQVMFDDIKKSVHDGRETGI